MKNSLFQVCLALLCWFVVSNQSIQGAVIISTLTTDSGNGGLSSVSTHNAYAMGFALPSGISYTLDDVSLRLSVSVATSFNWNVALYGDSSGNPSTQLTTFNLPALSLGISDYTFTPTSAVTLDAGSTYWVVAYGNQNSSSGSLIWRGGPSMTYSSSLATSMGSRVSLGGSTIPPVNSITSGRYYSVNATAASVPEISEFSLVTGLGCIAFAFWRFKTRTASV